MSTYTTYEQSSSLVYWNKLNKNGITVESISALLDRIRASYEHSILHSEHLVTKSKEHNSINTCTRTMVLEE